VQLGFTVLMTLWTAPLLVHEGKRFLPGSGQGQVLGMAVRLTRPRSYPVAAKRDAQLPVERILWARVSRECLPVQPQVSSDELARGPAPRPGVRNATFQMRVKRIEKLQGFVHRHSDCFLETSI